MKEKIIVFFTYFLNITILMLCSVNNISGNAAKYDG